MKTVLDEINGNFSCQAIKAISRYPKKWGYRLPHVRLPPPPGPGTPPFHFSVVI
jgi:hypothetical protein